MLYVLLMTQCVTIHNVPIDKISPPTNVQLTLLPRLREVFLTWEPGENYYGLPYPNISFFLKITYAVNGSEATPRLQVIGKVQTLAMDYLCDYYSGHS